jgi:hypothetical protein
MCTEFEMKSKGVLKPWTGWALCIDREDGAGKLRHYYTSGQGPSCNGLPLSTMANDRRWHHFAYAADEAGVELFIDGKRTGPRPLPQSARESQPINLFLGPSKFADPNRNKFRGEVCAVRLSSAKRYKDDFQPPAKFDQDDQTVALLDFSQGQGETIDDRSGRGHHGKITGAKWIPLGE